MKFNGSHGILFQIILIATIVSAQTVYAQVSVSPGDWITVTSGGSMMIGTDLHLKSDATGSGYLVDQNPNGDITITGDVNVDRYMTADVWHNASSPVSNASSSVYTGTDLVFWYNEALILNDWNFGWVWYYGSTGGALDVFRGYDVYIPTNPVTIYYEATGSESINTGPYSLTVINTASTPSEIPSHKGWNLLGNPYPSPVDWMAAAGLDKSNINDAKYIWDGTNDIYTIYVGGGSPIGLNGGTRFIPSNQGFWVQSSVASGTVSINNAARVGDISGTPDYYKEKPVDYPLVSLVASDETHHDEIIIRFLEGTTFDFDLNYDAMKLFSINDEVPQLYLEQGKHKMALNTLPAIEDDLALALYFRCAKEGLFSIELEPRTNLSSSTEIYLFDRQEKKTINLGKDSLYSFYHHVYDAGDRFTVYFNPNPDIINNITPDSWFLVYSNGNTINIIKNTIRDIHGEIRIFNMMGQPLYHSVLGNDEKRSFQVNFPTGYYIVSLVTQENVINTKIFVLQ